jgi:parallel beta-helix repeat protein
VNVAFYSLGAATSMVFSNNVVSASGGPGVIVESASGIVLTQNSIFGNGVATGLGIDLDARGVDPNGYMPPQGVSLNDAGDADAGPNGLLNFPVIESAVLGGGSLTLKGWALPGSLVELFVAAADAAASARARPTCSRHRRLGADADATTSTYGPGAVNGVLQARTRPRASRSRCLPPAASQQALVTATAALRGQRRFSAFRDRRGLPGLHRRRRRARSAIRLAAPRRATRQPARPLGRSSASPAPSSSTR